MAKIDLAFAGSIPEIHDTYLVPIIFEAYATDLAKRVAALSPNTIPETSQVRFGTGYVSGKIRAHVFTATR